MKHGPKERPFHAGKGWFNRSLNQARRWKQTKERSEAIYQANPKKPFDPNPKIIPPKG